MHSVTSAYLACKVEEFNVSIEQFIANIRGDKERAMDIVLNNELLLMRELNFHLTVHNPFRPVEGLLIDVKVSFVQSFALSENENDILCRPGAPL